MKVLIVNHKQQQCGVYQFGKRIYELAKTSDNIVYDYIEADTFNEFEAGLGDHEIILYNWYPVTMPWLSDGWIDKNKRFKHLFLFHDGNIKHTFDKYIFSGSEGKDINIPEERTAIVPRPLFFYDGDYQTNSVITIGSFGFGGWQKGFTRLVEMVNNEFEEAVINIQMPFAYFGDRFGVETRKIAEACRKLNTNPKITLNIDHTFLSNEETLKFLARNDINLFLYKSSNQGLSSVIDYALSVKRPLGITNDSMFKHMYKDDICIDKHSIRELIEGGTKPLEEFYNKWNPSKFSIEMDKVIYASQ